MTLGAYKTSWFTNIYKYVDSCSTNTEKTDTAKSTLNTSTLLLYTSYTGRHALGYTAQVLTSKGLQSFRNS